VLEHTAEKHSSIEAFSADGGYRGTAVEFVNKELNLELHISEKIQNTFNFLPDNFSSSNFGN
jgi:hypothetical protein